MDLMESLGLVCFTGFFLLAIIAVFAVIAIVSTQAKIQSAKRILRAQTEGAFADLETPKNKFRMRLLAIIALIGILGMALSIAVIFIQMLTQSYNYYWVAIVIGLIFGGMGPIAGFLMQREINRRI
jgi:hypothetical protein